MHSPSKAGASLPLFGSDEDWTIEAVTEVGVNDAAAHFEDGLTEASIMFEDPVMAEVVTKLVGSVLVEVEAMTCVVNDACAEGDAVR